jgi:hypothetical protein
MMVPVATDHETLLRDARQQDTAKAQIISGSFGDVRYWQILLQKSVAGFFGW